MINVTHADDWGKDKPVDHDTCVREIMALTDIVSREALNPLSQISSEQFSDLQDYLEQADSLYDNADFSGAYYRAQSGRLMYRVWLEEADSHNRLFIID